MTAPPLTDNTPGLKAKIRNGVLSHGLFCFTPSTLIVEFIAFSGFDFVIIDTEHSLISAEYLDHMIVAGRSMGLSVLVRIPLTRSYLIAPVLDAGAEGVVFPCIRSRDEAERAVALCHYPPKGERGLSVHRHLGYKSTDLASENKRANDQAVVALMIENKLGLEACADIAQVPGVDFLLEGAADLSASLDVPWETRHPSVLEAVARIDSIARASNLAFCAIPRAKQDYVTWRTIGLSLFVLGTDRGVIRKGMKGHLSEFTSSEHQ